MKNVLGEEHPWTLSTMHSLALGYRQQGNVKKSREILERVLERRKKILGEKHPNTTDSLKEPDLCDDKGKLQVRTWNEFFSDCRHMSLDRHRSEGKYKNMYYLI